ncbi:hypothetical protein [Pantoea septica]|uniref:hypothetical protein n=1 Tax=Pantoea septica TaxID=472695 RepID=UPI0023F99FF8|nr:hypothetical protein [Pantoea septica]
MSEINSVLDDSNVFYEHAMVRNGETKVLAVVNVPASYKVNGFSFVKIPSGVYCEKGMYYNEDDGLFYDDEDFTTINGVSTEPDSGADETEPETDSQ